MKFTPGPWRLHKDKILADVGHGVARIAIVDDGEGTEAVNGTLIAAAPEMYEALLNILQLKATNEYDEELWTKAWAKGVNALRIANGEEPEREGE